MIDSYEILFAGKMMSYKSTATLCDMPSAYYRIIWGTPSSNKFKSNICLPSNYTSILDIKNTYDTDSYKLLIMDTNIIPIDIKNSIIDILYTSTSNLLYLDFKLFQDCSLKTLIAYSVNPEPNTFIYMNDITSDTLLAVIRYKE